MLQIYDNLPHDRRNYDMSACQAIGIRLYMPNRRPVHCSGVHFNAKKYFGWLNSCANILHSGALLLELGDQCPKSLNLPLPVDTLETGMDATGVLVL